MARDEAVVDSLIENIGFVLFSRTGFAFDVLVVSSIVVGWIVVEKLFVVCGVSDLAVVEIAWVEIEHARRGRGGTFYSKENRCLVYIDFPGRATTLVFLVLYKK